MIRNGRYCGTYEDRDEALAVARRIQPPVMVHESEGTYEVWELGVRGADGVNRDRRYPSIWGLEIGDS